MQKILYMYLDYVNNFLTVGKFASYYGISEEKANRLINLGRKIHNRTSKYWKIAENVDNYIKENRYNLF